MLPTERSTIVILPYKRLSQGAKTLQVGLKAARSEFGLTSKILVEKETLASWHPTYSGTSDPHPRFTKISYINWGNSGLVNAVNSQNVVHMIDNNARLLNAKSGLYSDKIKFFRALDHSGLIPKFFTEDSQAISWMMDNPGKKLCIRLKTSASGGDGLSVVSDYKDIIPAPLYVEYKPKKHEFRYHFFRGADGFLQQKRLRSGTENKNFEIRNHANNWVYCRDAVDDIPAVYEFCLKLKSQASTWGLDFGAFDIIYNQSENKCYVLEINTAPGLEGQTAKDYVNYFIKDHVKNTRGVLDAV